MLASFRSSLLGRFIVGVLLLASRSEAHHSFATHYDADKPVEIKGVVVDFQLISPHSFIIVDVTKEDGSVERWEVETNSANNRRRRGWDENTFKPGDVITVSGSRHRRDIPQMFGREFIGARGAVPTQRPSIEELVAAYPPDPDARGFAGRWVPEPTRRLGREAGPQLPLTPAGFEAWQNYDAERSLVTTCEPMNIPTLFHVTYLLDIQVDEETVLFDHELYDIKRKVPLASEPKLQESSGLFGMAAGRMQGDTLVVESDKFPPSSWGLGVQVLDGGDIPSSAQKKITERYSVSDDGKILRLDFTVEDPVYLMHPYSGYREWTRVADNAPIRYAYNCDPDSASLFTG